VVSLALLLACSTSPTRPSPLPEPAARRPPVATAARAIAAVEPPEKPLPDELVEYATRMRRGIDHYRLARAALEERGDEAYREQIGLAHDQFVEAVRLRPRAAEPHVWMGIVLAYRSDLPGALASFQAAHALEPENPQHYTNMAQTLIYLGDLEPARLMLDEARRRGAYRPWVNLTGVLAAWRSGDLANARQLFSKVVAEDPKFVQRWDQAAIRQSIQSFEDFAAFCCANPSCGPHMGDGCLAMKGERNERDQLLESLRKEYELERERRRRRKQLEIEVDESTPRPAR
jgi:tetratricopeptide (TPR) repeat protein